MKAVLICPDRRPETSVLADEHPLALIELFGKPLLAYWLEFLYGRGIRTVTLLVSDRPDKVREFVGDGARWGMAAQVVPRMRELQMSEVCARGAEGEGRNLVAVIDHFPGRPDCRLFSTFEGFFEGLRECLPEAMRGPRLGVREIQPGVRAGMRSRIAPDARLYPPCWIGEETEIGSGAVIGPMTVLEKGVVVEPGVIVSSSYACSGTFFGQGIRVRESLVLGGCVVNWRTGVRSVVSDAFLLCPLDDPGPCHGRRSEVSRIERAVALALLLGGAPLLFLFVLWKVTRGRPAFRAVRAVKFRSQTAGGPGEFVHYQLAANSEWLRRWPRLWNIARGEFAWVGNPPIEPELAEGLSLEHERLWVQTPPGFVSLLDAEGCRDLFSDEARAHAAFYSARKSRRLDLSILWKLAISRRGALMRQSAGHPVPLLPAPIARPSRGKESAPFRQAGFR